MDALTHPRDHQGLEQGWISFLPFQILIGDAFRERAAQMQLHPTPVEKDFWLCYLLRELFSLDCVKDQLIFKGGTSLSKTYGLIQRFSEDIDLSIHASTFGIDLESHLSELSPSEDKIEVSRLFKAAAQFVDESFIPELRARLEESLPEGNWRLQPHRRSDDLNIILFKYHRLIQDGKQPHYTSPEVQIEIGVRAEHDPAEQRIVRPYVAEQFPDIFEQPDAKVKVLSAKRTFWEKATIYHAESFKPAGQPWTRRYARHAYDLHQLMNSEIGEEALRDLDLLKRVAVHKATFHASKGVNYHQAYQGNLRLSPKGSRQEELADDYKAMKDFFMTDNPPPFEKILKSLETIEQRTNAALS